MSLAQLVDDLATRAGGRSSRRRFLERSALAGAALSVAPAAFGLRPGTAYAAICGCSGSSCDCSAACCDGYTEFCCTMTGINGCPSGTLLGGWWKVDGSSYCGGGPRYYLDCNATCGSCGCGSTGICSGSCSGTTCRCANGSCGNRKAGCTGFRYGQCHQEVPCLGPIVCRVVTCTAPWELDATCGTASRTDEATRNHNRPCLQGMPFGNIDSVTPILGGLRVVGWAIDPDTASSIDVHVYANDVGFGSGRADRHRDDIAAAYPSYGPYHGFQVDVPYTAGGEVAVCAFGINVGGGPNSRFACRTVVAGQPFGNIDSVNPVPGGLRVTGWAIDPDITGPIDVHVYAGDQGFGSGRADRPRADVAAAYPGFGGNHGFEVELPYTGGGPVSVCAYGLNVGSGPNPRLACRTVTAGLPFGNIDAALREPGGIRVRGWAIDPDVTSSITVHVYAGSEVFASGVANIPRDDVAAAYPRYGGNHGFEILVPYTRTGQVSVCAYGLNHGPGPNQQLACRNA